MDNFENLDEFVGESGELEIKLQTKAYDYVIKNFSWDSLLPKYVKFYEKLIS